MFTQKIIDSDPFLDMPLSTQALYFHLNMRADDDGFINNPKRIQRTVGASEDDLKLLIAKRFVICFENGVIVIKHWRMHNTLRKDRYNPTQYQEEYAKLDIKDNNAYTEKAVATTWQPDGNQLETQYSIDKYSIDKKSIVEDSVSESDDSEPSPKPSKKPVKHKHGEYNNVLLTDEELEKLKDEYSDWEERIERLSSYVASTGKAYKSHYATIRNWARKDQTTQKGGNNNGFNRNSGRNPEDSKKQEYGVYL
jgi:Asp-tRNA(Asn)/Glu-tRNA(Gln) amidotransferase C subunit